MRKVGNIVASSIMVASLIFVFVFIISLIAHSQKSNTPIEISSSELLQVDNSIKQICLIDVNTCQLLKDKSIKYRVIPLDWYYSIFDIYHLTNYAVTFHEDRNYEIRIADTVFKSDIALTMFLYHEYQHVLHGKYFKITEPQDTYPACIEHNFVKNSTSVFAEKYQSYLIGKSIPMSKLDSPTYIASLSGNQPKTCVLGAVR